jgi:chorismate mutase
VAEVLTIEELRRRIDSVDDQLVRLLNLRVTCAVEIGRLKKPMGVAVYQPAREELVLARVQKAAVALAGPLQADAVVRIFERVMDEGRRAERVAGDSDVE